MQLDRSEGWQWLIELILLLALYLCLTQAHNHFRVWSRAIGSLILGSQCLHHVNCSWRIPFFPKAFMLPNLPPTSSLCRQHSAVSKWACDGSFFPYFYCQRTSEIARPSSCGAYVFSSGTTEFLSMTYLSQLLFPDPNSPSSSCRKHSYPLMDPSSFPVNCDIHLFQGRPDIIHSPPASFILLSLCNS